MKKLKALTILSLIVLLSACSFNKEVTYKCKYQASGDPLKVNYTYVTKGDKITNIKMAQILDIATSGSDEQTLQVQIDAVKESYDEIKGLDYKTTFKDNTLKEEISIDMKKASMSNLLDAGLVEAVNDKTPKFISFKETKKNLEDIGATCEK